MLRNGFGFCTDNDVISVQFVFTNLLTVQSNGNFYCQD